MKHGAASTLMQGRTISPPSMQKARPVLPCADSVNIRWQENKCHRRALLHLSVGMSAPWLVYPGSSKADVLKDIAKQVLRPDIDFPTALVMMLDARGFLLEIQGLATSASDNAERGKLNSFLPRIARSLRDVSQAAPTVAAYIMGADKEETVSQVYGGEGGERAGLVDPIFLGVGKVLTPSGRGIRQEALVLPEVTEDALNAISTLLEQVPSEQMDMAQTYRKSRSQ